MSREPTVPHGPSADGATASRAEVPNPPTRLRVELDCPVCLTATLDRLARLPEVVRVEAHTAAGCLLVEHRGPVDRVVATIEEVGHRIEVGSNGEAVMAAAVVEQVEDCCHRRSPVARTAVVATASGPPS